MSPTFLDLFYSDHSRINQLLLELKREIRLKDVWDETIQSLRWMFERHFYLEEKLICQAIQNPAQNQVLHFKAIFMNILNDHNSILNHLNTIEDIMAESPFSIKSIREETENLYFLNKKHIAYEMENFYSVFDTLSTMEMADLVKDEFTKKIIDGFYPSRKTRECIDQELEKWAAI